MSRAILTGRASQQVGPGPVQLNIASAEVNSGVTISGNTFALADLGDFYINAALAVDSIQTARTFTFELFNETLGTQVQAWKMQSEATGIGDSQTFLFSATNTDASHFYSLRIYPTGGGSAPRMNFVLSRVLITGFSAVDPSAITGTGTANVMAKFTGAQTIGNSGITDNGTTVSTAEPFVLNVAAAGGYIESVDGSSAAVSGAATGRIRYNNTAGAWQVSVQGGAYANIATGTGLLGRTDSASPFATTLGSSGAIAGISGVNNTAVGYNALNAQTTGTDATAMGFQAGLVNTAIGNTFIGSQAGMANTTTTGHVHIGYQAGLLVTGADNTIVGYQAGDAFTTGARNSLFGKGAGGAAGATAMSDCTFLGYQAGLVNTANNNTFVGSEAGVANISGSTCVYIGYQSGKTATGTSNTMIGANAGDGLVGGGFNVGVGLQVFNANSAQNVIIGYQAGSAITGSNNVVVGYQGSVSSAARASSVSVGASTSLGGDSSVAIGFSARVAASGVTIGASAGTSGMSGADNVIIGSASGDGLTTGARNCFLGSSAGGAASANAMSDTVMIGYNAGLLNTANQNTFIGSLAGDANTSGTGQCFVGYNAGTSVTGNDNTIVGHSAGDAFTTGARNCLFGKDAGGAAGATSMSDSTFLGYQTGLLTTGNQNTFVGSQAGASNTTGTTNVCIGYLAGYYIQSGTQNVVIGSNTVDAGSANNLQDCVVIGYGAGRALATGAANNTVVGSGAGDSFTTGVRNCLFGKDAGGAAAATAMSDCTLLGYQAGLVNTADQNTFIGASAGDANTSGTGQVYIGYNAGGTATGNDNTIVGHSAGDAFTTGARNVIIGKDALGGASATSPSDNVIVGYNAAAAVTTAGNNVVIGSGALVAATVAGNNVAIGSSALAGLTTGSAFANNIGIGSSAGDTLTTGYYSIFIGSNSDGLSSSTNNAIAIGISAVADTNELVIGSGTAPINNWYSGQGRTAASASAYTINGTGGSGSDNAGAALLLMGGKGTGTAASGYVGMTYPLLTTTGSTLQTVSTLKNYLGGFIYVTTADLTLTASTSTTGTLIGAQTNAVPQGTLTLDANLLRVANVVRIKGYGLITQSGGGPTLTIEVKLGATVVATGTVPLNGGGVTNGGITFESVLVCRSTGATGTVMGDGVISFQTATGGTNAQVPMYKAVTTVDTTAANAIDVYGTWSANTAGNAITITNLTIEYR